MSEQQGNLCLKPGDCLNPQGDRMSRCPTGRDSERYVDTTPLLAAESLCLNGLRDFTESRNASQLVDDWASICYDLDRAIAIPSVHQRDYIRDLLTQITVMLHRNNDRRNWLNTSQPMISLQLKRVGIFMPAFKARAEGHDPRGLAEQMHRGLSGYIGTLDDMLHQLNGNLNLKKQITAHKSECEIMALFTRAGEIPYPAVIREEASHARKQNNHDFYTLRGRRKQAYQVKTSAQGRGYNNVSVIRHFDILRALHQDPTTHRVEWQPARGHADFEWPNPYRYEQVLAGEKPSPLAELLTEEQRLGNKMPQDMRNALNLASSYVRSR